VRNLRNMVRVPAVAAMVLLAAGAAQAINIATVPVGNVSNAADSTGYGSVAYSYHISTYEVTAGQYTAFLNAVAKTDTYRLYNAYMGIDTTYGCQIQRNGSSGSYSYSVSWMYEYQPVNYVSFWDACRFANWLNNGQGASGTTEYGTYSLNGVMNPTNSSITRNAGAKWAVTSENEWYKAAYYNGTTGLYNLYPTGGNGISTGMANYNYSEGHPENVGSYAYASPYGTFDQGGNVWEWNEAVITGSYSDSYRCIRGGSYEDSPSFLRASYRPGGSFPTDEYPELGFRVSEVPEPATLSLLAMGGLAILRRRRAAKQ
jgi:formylglycine-generating enzyme